MDLLDKQVKHSVAIDKDVILSNNGDKPTRIYVLGKAYAAIQDGVLVTLTGDSLYLPTLHKKLEGLKLL